MSRPVVALAGNPNCGKSTLFNALTGANARVGNYPGVTVERREGRGRLSDGREIVVLDIPGTCSLSARTAEEQIAITAMAGLSPFPEPDVVVVVVDATQLARNLYLLLQVLELRQPVVVALNMQDVLRRNGMRVDAATLSARLGGVPVVPISARRGEGLVALMAAVAALVVRPDGMAAAPSGEAPQFPESPELAADLDAIEPHLPAGWSRGDARRRRALSLWALLSVDADDELDGVPAPLRQAVLARQAAAAAAGRDLDLESVSARYRWIDGQLPALTGPVPPTLRRLSDAIDAVLIHPLTGFLLFVAIMGLLFESLFTWSAPLIAGVETAVGIVAAGVRAALPESILRDLLTEGVIAGVGAVLVFLPQILLLFLFVSILEDSGYMARAAFLMDRLMKALGLTGRAFVPMLSGYACAIPAIMATRTMERRRDRLLTMMVVPIMTCSARLPVYTLVISALFAAPDEPGGRVAGLVSLQALMLVGMYLFGTAMALVSAAVLGRTLLRGAGAPLLLELPPYRLPGVRTVLRMMWERSRLFVSEAGTVILVCTIVLWLLLSFPRAAEPPVPGDPLGAGPVAEALAGEDLDDELAARQLADSWGGRLGRLIEPTIAPLGFDWKIGIGLIGAFAAREVFVSTLGVVHGVGDADEESLTLRERIRQERRPDGQPAYTPLVGVSLLVFFALAAQCMSTLAVVRRETGGWRWPLFLFGYMTALAWICSFAVYQGGLRLGFA